MSGTETDTDAMAKHGKHLTGEITSALGKAHATSTEVKLGADVMGELCQAWSFIFDDEVAAAQEMLQQLPKAMDASGGRVLDAAKEFRERDDRNRENFEGLDR